MPHLRQFGGNVTPTVFDQFCGATAPIDLWSVEPLNYAQPAGWTWFIVRGRLRGERCPACTQRLQAAQPEVQP